MTTPQIRAGQRATELVHAIEAVIGSHRGGLHEPLFAGNEKVYVNECIDSGVVSSVGSFVGRFEDELADYVGASHAVAVVNGTSALHLALVVSGVKPGDEVIVPALSFVATASAVALAGATPHFVDVGEGTWGMEPAVVRVHLEGCLTREGDRWINKGTGRPVTAILPMHTLGHPFDAAGIKAIAEDFGLIFIEDAAESLGSFSDGAHTGLCGSMGVFSFNGNKTITTGGGGAIVTDSAEMAAKLRHMSTTAKVPHRYEFDHDEIGFNYRMPNINAALGVAQLEKLPTLIEGQRLLHYRYARAFEPLEFGALKTEETGARSNYWLQAFVLGIGEAGLRDQILTTCLDQKITVRPLWKPLNSLAPYVSCPSADTPVANDLYERVICLPSSVLPA